MTEAHPEDTPPVEIVDAGSAAAEATGTLVDGSKLMRIASMTRAMLEEVRQAPLDEAGRKRLRDIYDRSLDELSSVLPEELKAELTEVFIPLAEEVPSESSLRIAQAQLVGWLEGLFNGIQAALMSQQMAAQAQLVQMRKRRELEARAAAEKDEDFPGVYL